MKLEFNEETAGILELKLPGREKSVRASVYPFTRSMAKKISEMDKKNDGVDNIEQVFDSLRLQISMFTKDLSDKVLDELTLDKLMKIRDALLKVSMGNDRIDDEKKTK